MAWYEKYGLFESQLRALLNAPELKLVIRDRRYCLWLDSTVSVQLPVMEGQKVFFYYDTCDKTQMYIHECSAAKHPLLIRCCDASDKIRALYERHSYILGMMLL